MRCNLEKEKIGFLIIATNNYFALGIRLVKKIQKHFIGDLPFEFYFFSDMDPNEYLPENFPLIYYSTSHKNWLEGTNSKYNNIKIAIEKNFFDKNEKGYLIYLDADTDIKKDLHQKTLLKNLIACRHYADQHAMKKVKNYDRNPNSKAFIPENTKRPQMYYHACVMGGEIQQFYSSVLEMEKWQKHDQDMGYEAIWNDESYWNKFLHYTEVDPILNYTNIFVISDGGGIIKRETEKTQEYFNLLKKIKEVRNYVFEIEKGRIIVSDELEAFSRRK